MTSERSAEKSSPPDPEIAAAKIPFWLWPTILSFDAPAVAIVWLCAFAAAFAVSLHPATIAALGLAVWIIYAADRLLDGFAPPYAGEPERHRFYRRHRRRLIPLLIAAALAVGALAILAVPFSVIRNEAALGLVVVLYFAIIHAAALPKALWPKELAVAILFAAGTSIPVITLANDSRAAVAFAAILFAAACWINTTAIECWENAPDRAARARLTPAPSRLLACNLRSAASLLAALSITLAILAPTAQAHLFAAIALSALLLAALESVHHRLARPALRVMADAALLSPLLFLLL